MTSGGGTFERAGAAILRHPRAVAAGALVAAALCVFALTRLRIDPNVEHLLPADDPTLRLTRHLQGDFSTTRTLFIILRGEDPRGLEAAVAAAADRLRRSPLVTAVAATREEFAGARVEWIRRSPLYFLPGETLDRLEERLRNPGREAELKLLPERLIDPLGGKITALADPLGLRWIFEEASERLASRFPVALLSGTPYLIARQPAVAFLRVIGAVDSPNTRFSRQILADLRTRLEEATREAPARFELAGAYVTAVTQEAALKRDMIVESVVSTIAVLLYAWFFARSLLAAHLVFVPVLLSIAGSLALGAAVFGPLTPIVVSAAAILIAQGIDFPMHYFCRFRDERLTRDRDASLHAAQVSMARPFAGIAATTLAAFASLMISRFPGFRQLGFVLSVGIALCLVLALTLFPILLMPVDRWVRPRAERIPIFVRAAESTLRTRWRTVIAWIIVALGTVSWLCVWHWGVRMDLDLRNAMAPGDPGRIAMEKLEEDIGAAMLPVYVLADASMTPDDLRRATAALKESRAVVSADGLHELLPSPEARDRVARFRERTRGWIDGTLSDLARLGFRPDPFRKGLQEMEARFSAPAPEEADLERPEFAALRRSVRYEEGGRRHHVVTLFSPRSVWAPETRARFDDAVKARLGPTAELFSPFHLPDHYSRVLNEDLARAVLLTSIGIVVLTLISVGGFKDGLWALAPVVLATGMTLATAVFLGGTIDVINMAAIPIILAVGVDGGIHFMVRFRESGRRDPAATIREVGPGIWGSAATTLLGFGSIATSVTPGMASMGYLVVAGTVTSVFASLFLLPGVLKRRDPVPPDENATPPA